MPEMSKKYVPKYFGDKNPNPKLIRLVRKITDRIPGKIKMTTEAPEYWGYACLFYDAPGWMAKVFTVMPLVVRMRTVASVLRCDSTMILPRRA